MTNVKIDNKDYEYEKLPPEAQSHIAAIKFCEGEIQRLQMKLSMTQTSLATYTNALNQVISNLEKKN